MNGPVQWGGTWWQQTPDGGWLRWDEAAQTWVAHVPQPSAYAPAPGPPGIAPQHTYQQPAYAQYGYGGTGASGPRAGFWLRFLATLIDTLILAVPMAALYYVLLGDVLEDALTGATPQPVGFSREMAVFQLVSLAVSAAYYGLQEGGPRGQTLGKRAAGIRVIDFRTGGPIGVGRALLRVIGRYISSIPCGLGYFWMLWDREKQTWHDKISDCVVVPVAHYPIT